MAPKKPQSKMPLFTEGEYRHLVAINFLGNPKNRLDLYADAYHKAGKTLARRYGNRSSPRDYAACPVVFLYRHALELYLKAFLVSGNKLLAIRGKPSLNPDPLKTGHRLMALLPGFERITDELGWNWNMGVTGLRSKQDFVALLSEFDSVDGGSFSFRYPTNKDGNPSLPKGFRFSLKIFAAALDKLLGILAGAGMGAEATADEEAENRDWFGPQSYGPST